MLPNSFEGGSFIHHNAPSPGHASLPDLFSLKGKTAIITGAAGGIGLAVAQGLAEAGANVALWYNSNTKCPESAAEIAFKYSVQAKAYQVDITNAQAVQEAVDHVVNDLNGRLDIFIANAGIPWTAGPIIDGPLDQYSTVIDVNLNGTFYCAKAAAAHWRRQKDKGTDINGKDLVNFTYGSFVATASIGGHIVQFPQMQAPYNAAKAGMIHLCKSLAMEWVRFARVNTVSPGYIVTEIAHFVPQEIKDMCISKIPMGRDGLPHELKGAYLYLASDASSYTTGADIVVDGGFVLP